MTIEGSPNQYTFPMRDGKRLHGGALADYATTRIDEFFATEALLTEDDKYRAGLAWAVEHGWITDEQALFLERDNHLHLLGEIALGHSIETEEIVVESPLL